MADIMINMADSINTTNEAIALAIACITAYKLEKITHDTVKIVLGACADCADDCGGMNEYINAYNKAIEELL